MLRLYCPSHSSSAQHSSLQGAIRNDQLPKDDVSNNTDMSLRPSQHLNPVGRQPLLTLKGPVPVLAHSFDFDTGKISGPEEEALHLEKTLPGQSSISWDPEKSLQFSYVGSILSDGSPSSKSSAELMNEIATLETEIMHLESYLLSLYRTAFEQNLLTSSENHGTHLWSKMVSPLQFTTENWRHKVETDMWKSGTAHSQIIRADCLTGSRDPRGAATTESSRRLQVSKNVDHGHCSLADHLGTSHFDATTNCPDKLSEDIVRCISSIYCKLAGPTLTRSGFSVSSSSLSSASTSSPRNLTDSWSPCCNEEAMGHCQFRGLTEGSGPHAGIVEVLKICLDDDSFNYAATMLQTFRSLVKSLEKVDPRNMKREEKLAFWINVHNALLMHAYLAYGTQNYIRSTKVLKAAYSVGGHCINAYVIQNSILGIRSHYSEPWLQTLLSPGRMLKTGSTSHPFAIEYPEPLVHFALCSGAFSDPLVRVYKAKSVFQDLRLAEEEFVRASVYVHKETKIYLPKVLGYFAKDMLLTMPELLKIVNGCLSEVRQNAIQRCLKGRPNKYIHWLPQSSTFRYVIQKEVAEHSLSV